VGILTLDTVFPRIPGDVGNATTFDFPVRFAVVRGASPRRVVHDPGVCRTWSAARRTRRTSTTVQAATGRPFFDIVTMTRWVYAAVVKRATTSGFM